MAQKSKKVFITERKLDSLKFQKKELGDKSSYWYEKPIKKLFRGKCFKEKQFIAYADPDGKFNQYQIQYIEKHMTNEFLEFPSLKSMLKFIRKNGKL